MTTYSWKAIVEREDKDRHKPDVAYRFSNGREFVESKSTPGVGPNEVIFGGEAATFGGDEDVTW